MQGLIHRRWNGEFIKLHQEVILLVYAERFGISAKRIEVLRVQMKITSGSHGEPAGNFSLQFVTQPPHSVIFKSVLAVRVRSRDNVRNAIRNSSFCHGQGSFDGVGAVVYTRKDVAVNVYHVLRDSP